MSFPFEVYAQSFLVLPGLVLIFSIPISLALIKQIINCVLFVDFRKNLAKQLITFCGIIFLMIPQFMYLIPTGVAFLTEKPSDAMTTTGIITNIIEPSDRFHGFKYQHQYGADIQIDGNQYFIVSCGDIKIGTTVEIMYLPKSRCILYIRQYQ